MKSPFLLEGVMTDFFVGCRSEVDDVKKKLTVLAPNPGRLPKRFLVLASQKWMET